jgi:hypothetical protein
MSKLFTGGVEMKKLTALFAVIFVFILVGSVGADDLTTLSTGNDQYTNAMVNVDLYQAMYGAHITNFEINDDKTQFSVTYRQESMFAYPEGGGPPDHVWKEVYGIEDGKIVNIKTIEGKHIPSQYIEEKIIFEEEEK